MSGAAASDSAYRQAPDNHALGHIPGDDGWPVLGRAVAVARDLHALSEEHLLRYGPVSRIRLMDQRILLDREGQFSAEKGYEGELGRFYQGGLLLTDFDEHRLSRRLMQGAFKPAALERYLAMMQPLIDAQLHAWGEQPHFVFYPHVKQLLLQIGARCFLGIEDMRDEGQLINELFLDLNAGMVTLLRLDLPFTGYGRALRARQRLEAWFASQVERRRADPAGAGDSDHVLSHLCRETDEAGQPYGQQMIVNHAIFLLFAAHDTTASALTHLAMYIGRDADLQQRLREALAPSGLAERCLHEAMRLHPPVPMMVRRTISAVELDGVAVPAHTLLFMPTVMNHIDPRWWQEPARFDPERFAPARAEQRYTLQTPAGYAPRLEWVPLPKPADGVPLRLTRL